MTLHPSWHQITSDGSNLLSPMKTLLTASENPLNPCTSPFFSSKHNLVVAPHPSELPLPSLSLTPKKNMSSEAVAENSINKQENTVNNLIEDMSLKNNESDNSNAKTNSNKEKYSTPTKQCK